MTITMLFIWLAYKLPVHVDMPLMIAPQAVCPLNLWEDTHTALDMRNLFRSVKEPI
jgi:hypothetical protein